MVKIRIDGEELDLLYDSQVALTLTANNMLEPDKLNSSFTDRFTVPLTRRNIGIVGNLLSAWKNSIAYTGTTASIELPGLISQEGKLYFLEANRDGVECAFVSGVANLFDDFGEYTLQHCDIGGVERTEANIVARIDNEYPDETAYSFLDFGQDVAETATVLAVEYMYPHARLGTVIEKMCEYVGWSVSNTGLMADSYFRKLWFAWNGNIYNKEAHFRGTGDLFGFSESTAPGNYINVAPITAPDCEQLDDATGRYFFDASNKLRHAFIFEGEQIDILTNASGEYHFKIRLGVYLYAGLQFLYSVDSYDSGLVTTTPNTNVTVSFPTLIADWQFSSTQEGMFIVPEMEVVKGLEVDLVNYVFRFDFAIQRDLPTGITARADVFLPPTKMGDFLKDICRMFQAVPKVDTVRKTVEIVLLNDIVADDSGPDWSAKLDSSKDIEKVFALDPYGQANECRYDNDDPMKEGFAGTDILVSNVNLDTGFELVKPAFSATQEKFFATSKLICIIPVFSGSPTEYDDELNPRFVALEKITGGSTLTVGAMNVTTYNLSRFSFAVGGQSAAFGSTQGLVAYYFGGLQRLLNESEVVTAYFKLDTNDITGLELLKPVYINASAGLANLSGYYLINEISEYQAGKIAKVELVRIGV